MNEIKLSKQPLKFDLDSGRFTLASGNRSLLGLRGLHVAIETEKGTTFSTETGSINYNSNRSEMHTVHSFLPIEFFWEAAFIKDKLHLSIRMDVKERLKIQDISIFIPFNEYYNIFSLNNKRRSIFSFRELIIPGIPENYSFTVESSSMSSPPLRIQMHPEMPINQATISALCFDPLQPFIKISVMKSWKEPIELNSGKLVLFKGVFFQKSAYPNPFHYPVDIFAQKPVRSILVVSTLNYIETVGLAESLRRVMPVVQQSGNKIGFPEITVCTYRKEFDESTQRPVLQLPGTPWKIFQFSRKLSREIKPDLTVHIQKDINGSSGFKFSLLSTLLRVNYKVKLDQSCEPVFMINSFQALFSRKVLVRFKLRLKKSVKFLSTVFLLFCWLSAIPILFVKELMKKMQVAGKAVK